MMIWWKQSNMLHQYKRQYNSQKTSSCVQEDLLAEQSRRETAEASLFTWKVTSYSLGASTLAFAVIALLTARRCSR